MMNGNPPKVTAALNNAALACEMETPATTKAVTDFSEDAVPAWTTKVRGDGARPRTTGAVDALLFLSVLGAFGVIRVQPHCVDGIFPESAP